MRNCSRKAIVILQENMRLAGPVAVHVLAEMHHQRLPWLSVDITSVKRWSAFKPASCPPCILAKQYSYCNLRCSSELSTRVGCRIKFRELNIMSFNTTHTPFRLQAKQIDSEQHLSVLCQKMELLKQEKKELEVRNRNLHRDLLTCHDHVEELWDREV